MSGRRKTRSSSGGGVGRFFFALFLLAIGSVGGYLWRSYRPLALPIESPLVADKDSDIVADKSIKEIVQTANERAEKAETERDALRQELASLKSSQHKTEQELADLQIKSVLGTPAPQ